MSNILYDKKEDSYSFSCPHCDLLCIVKTTDIKCTIFRHAVFKKKL